MYDVTFKLTSSRETAKSVTKWYKHRWVSEVDVPGDEEVTRRFFLSAPVKSDHRTAEVARQNEIAQGKPVAWVKLVVFVLLGKLEASCPVLLRLSSS